MQHKQIEEVVSDAERSPRLTDWEKGFIENLRAGLLRHGENFVPTEAQVKKLRQIEAKIYGT